MFYLQRIFRIFSGIAKSFILPWKETIEKTHAESAKIRIFPDKARYPWLIANCEEKIVVGRLFSILSWQKKS